MPAIGRFGMRVFEPMMMPSAHWPGHVEANFRTGATMTYDMDGTCVDIPEARIVLFWAGVPNQLTALRPTGEGPVQLANLYLPVDTFLFMPHIAALQVAILGGAMIALPDHLCDARRVEGWYDDYRSGDVERREVLKMELNGGRSLPGSSGCARRSPMPRKVGRCRPSTFVTWSRWCATS
jgi:hypothetical protein